VGKNKKITDLKNWRNLTEEKRRGRVQKTKSENRKNYQLRKGGK
jgi:hypothetical protein